MTTGHEDWLALNKEDAIEPELPICDAHHHLWDHPGDRYLLDELMADLSGGHRVLETVFVECKSEYRTDGPEEIRPVGETESVREIADEAARKGLPSVAAAIVSHADFTLGSRVAAVLEAHLAASENVRGTRQVTASHQSKDVYLAAYNAPPEQLLDSRFREGYGCLRQYALHFDAWLYYPQLPELVSLAKAFPDTVIIVNHIGGLIGIGPYQGRRDEVFREWQQAIEMLASCANVVVKLGGFGMPRSGFGWAGQATPPGSTEIAKAIAPYCEWCIEKFGVDRSMFESNFPVDKKSFSYTVLWNAYKRVTERYSAEERNALLRDTALKVYRIGG